MKQILLLAFLLVFAFSASAQWSPDGSAAPQNTTEQKAKTPKISIFPNPATDFISLSTEEGVTEITVFNLVGRKMKSFEVLTDGRYNISDLPNGMYLIQLIDEQKKIITTHRISKR